LDRYQRVTGSPKLPIVIAHAASAFTPGAPIQGRIYDEPRESDGARLLVSRLWPHGVGKERAQLDRVKSF
jgi:hypothetical protein